MKIIIETDEIVKYRKYLEIPIAKLVHNLVSCEMEEGDPLHAAELIDAFLSAKKENYYEDFILYLEDSWLDMIFHFTENEGLDTDIYVKNKKTIDFDWEIGYKREGEEEHGKTKSTIMHPL